MECLDQSALALDFGSLGRPLGSVPLWARHKLAKRCHCQCEACADAPAHQNFQLPGTPTPQQLRATCCFGGGTPTPRLRATCCEAFSHPCGCWPGADGFRTSTLLIRPGAWLAGRKCWNAAAELLSGEVQDHVLANLPDDTPRMHALWIGVLVGLEHAQCTASVDTLLDLRLAERCTSFRPVQQDSCGKAEVVHGASTSRSAVLLRRGRFASAGVAGTCASRGAQRGERDGEVGVL